MTSLLFTGVTVERRLSACAAKLSGIVTNSEKKHWLSLTPSESWLTAMGDCFICEMWKSDYLVLNQLCSLDWEQVDVTLNSSLPERLLQANKLFCSLWINTAYSCSYLMSDSDNGSTAAVTSMCSSVIDLFSQQLRQLHLITSSGPWLVSIKNGSCGEQGGYREGALCYAMCLQAVHIPALILGHCKCLKHNHKACQYVRQITSGCGCIKFVLVQTLLLESNFLLL